MFQESVSSRLSVKLIAWITRTALPMRPGRRSPGLRWFPVPVASSRSATWIRRFGVSRDVSIGRWLSGLATPFPLVLPRIAPSSSTASLARRGIPLPASSGRSQGNCLISARIALSRSLVFRKESEERSVAHENTSTVRKILHQRAPNPDARYHHNGSELGHGVLVPNQP